MDSFEINKIAGAVLLAGIIAMSVGILSEGLVPIPEGHESHGGGKAATAGAEPAAGPGGKGAQMEPVTPLLAAANVQSGEKAAKKCTACHTLAKGEPARIGPNLWNIVNGPHGHMEGFAYSNPMKALHDEKWTYEALDKFLFKPAAAIPGTKMSFAGVPKTEERAEIIAYLRSLNDNPPPLP